MRVLVYDAHSYDREFLDMASRWRLHTQLHCGRARRADSGAGPGHPGDLLLRKRRWLRADPAPAGRRRHATAHAALHRLQQCRSGGGRAPGHHGTRVSAYSPYAVAEFAVGLLQTPEPQDPPRLQPHPREQLPAGRPARSRYPRQNRGRDRHWQDRRVFARIMQGFGCTVLAYDVVQNPACVAMGVRYTTLEELLAAADIVSLHVPLMPATHHLINAGTLALMKPGAMLINTSRGGLIDTEALLDALRAGRLGAVGAGCIRGGGRSLLPRPVGQVHGRRGLRSG